MNDYDPILLTQRQVFGRDTASGTLSTNDDYNEHIRPFGSPKPPAVQYDMLDYLTNGAGRYATPAVFQIVDKFFQSASIAPGTYTENSQNNSIYQALKIFDDPNTQEDELADASKVKIWQYGTDTTSLDFPERAYIFGTTDFKLDLANAEFEVDASGNKSITGMQVIALDDNFDFRGGAGPINAVANTVLLPAYDPYGLGIDPTTNGQNREVPIEYTTSTNGRTYGTSSDPYSKSDWAAHNLYELNRVSIKGTASGAAKLALGISQFLNPINSTLAGSYLLNINSDPFLRYLRDDFKVIYGTPGDDNLTHLDQENDLFDPLPTNTPVLIAGGTGDDNIIGSRMSDELLGGDGSDVIGGRGGDDTLNGGANNDSLDGGTGKDVAIFTDNFQNYDYSISKDKKTITIDHIYGTQKDGTDTLEDIEWAEFGRQRVDTGTLVASSSLDGIPIAVAPRLIPLPLADGVETTEYVEVQSTVASPNPNDPPTPPTISLTAPVAMLDGDVDYTLNILPYEPDTQYNVVYVIDTSISIDAVELQTIQDAYTDLTNFYINEGIAENINFGVVSFDSNGRFHTGSGGRNLTADEALVALQDLTIDTRIGTRYFDGLNQADRFLLNSRYNPFTTTGIGYFFTDGQNSGDRFDMLLKARDARELANFQAIAYYSDLDTLSSNSLKIRDINWIDSNQGVFLDDISDLPTELLKSDLADDLELVNILLDGEVVETITPDQLTDSPLGLTYSGSVEGLDVSIDAENIITAEVVFTDESNFATTTVDYTVTAGESEAVDSEGNDIPQSEDGNEDPFERIVDGSDSDDRITLGYADRGANGGAGGDEIVGNRRDNILDGGAGDDIISAYEGNDRITTGSGRDRVNGGSGIDTVIYDDVSYQDNNISLRKVGNSISYNNTDTLTDVEFIQLSDVRLSTDTQEITPVIEVAELSITEGNSDLTTARLDFNLSTPAPVDVVFDYSSEDIGSATAESDYIATSGQVTIPAGETSTSIDLEIIADRKNEESEQFALNFSNLSGATFSNNLTNDTVAVTIFDDDIAILDNGSGGQKTFTIAIDSGTTTISNFGGVGEGTNPSSAILSEVDVLKFVGAGLTADNLLLTQSGNDLILNFEGVDNTEAILTDFALKDLDNLPNQIGNLLFDQQSIIEDSIDVFDSQQAQAQVFDVNQVTFLDDLANNIDGRNSSADTINGQQGNDFLGGKGGNDLLRGGDGDDTLKGSSGEDQLIGGLGNDDLFGHGGDDILDGNDGYDYLHVYTNNEIILSPTQVIGDGTDTITKIEQANLNGLEGDNLINARAATIKALARGNDGNDTLLGGAFDDTLNGGSGNDNLKGGSGEDQLIGGNGNDDLFGHGGDDILDGNDGYDYLHVYTNNEIILSPTQLIGDGTDTISNIEQANLNGLDGDNLINVRAATIKALARGNDGSDTLLGGAFDDTLNGGLGDDILKGGSGEDQLIGGLGNDNLFGHGGDDILDGNDGYDYLHVYTDNEIILSNIQLIGDGTDTIIKIEQANLNGLGGDNSIDASASTEIKTVIEGNDGNDTLIGSQMGDNILGGNGSDVLYGSLGDDSLSGNDGNDIFVLESMAGTDEIDDFADGKDRFGLSSLEFGDLSITNNSGTVEIASNTNNQILAIVNNVSAADITVDDFVEL